MCMCVFFATAVSHVMGAAGQVTGVLSVETVSRHLAEGGQAIDFKAPASTVSTHKTSTAGPKRNDGSYPTAVSMVPIFS